MKKVALYARVSSEQQAEKDLSIPSQLKAMEEYSARQGWEVAARFVDEAQSARTSNRPEFRNMIALAKKKPLAFDVILVWKFSRFARNREDSIVYKSLLRKHGVQVQSLNEKLEDSPTGKLMEAVIESMDEFYSENLAQDTRRGMKETASRGFFYGGRAPLGYKVERVMEGSAQRGKLVLDPLTAPTVKRIFELFLKGHGGVEIASLLNRERLLTRNNTTWGKTTVYALLKNPVYTGDTVFNRSVRNKSAELQVAKDSHPALVSREDFEACQLILYDRSPRRMAPRAVTSPFLLSGLMRCGICGAAVTSTEARSGRFKYYTCTTHRYKGREVCPAKSPRKERLEAAVIACLQERVLTVENLQEILKLVNHHHERSVAAREDQRLVLVEQLTGAQKRRDKVYEAIETGLLPLQDLAPRLRDLNTEIEALKGRMGEIEASPGEVQGFTAAEIQEQVLEMRKLLSDSPLTQSKAFLRSFIKEITLDLPRVEIEYTMPLKNTEAEPPREVLLLVRNGSPSWTRFELPCS